MREGDGGWLASLCNVRGKDDFFSFSKASRVSLSARLYLRFLVDAVDDDASWQINVH